jgi:hypothetical protein
MSDTSVPTRAEIRQQQTDEIRAAMVDAMNAASARQVEGGRWLAGGLPTGELDVPAAGEAGRA